MTISSFFTSAENDHILSNLSVEQARAFVDLLILTVLVDEVVTEEELEALGEQWFNMPFIKDADLEQAMAAHGYETRAYLEEHVSDPSAVRDFLSERIHPLDTEELKLAALHMVATVSSADGVAGEETSLLHLLGELLDVEDEQIKSLVQDLNAQ